MLGIALHGCMPQYRYELARPSEYRGQLADSLRWEYSGDVITGVWVRNNGEVQRLGVGPKTILEVRTTSNELYRFYLQSIEVQDNGEGVVGATTVWRGYDTRQHAKRSVLLREVDHIEIVSDRPAVPRNSK